MYKIKNTELDFESRIFHLHKIFYSALFVENIAPIQEIDTANCIHFKLNSVVLNIHIDKKDNAKTNSIAFNIYFSFILL